MPQYPPAQQPTQRWVRRWECFLIPQYQQYNAQILPQELIGLQNWFNQVDRDHSGTIEVEELQYSSKVKFFHLITQSPSMEGPLDEKWLQNWYKFLTLTEMDTLTSQNMLQCTNL